MQQHDQKKSVPLRAFSRSHMVHGGLGIQNSPGLHGPTATALLCGYLLHIIPLPDFEDTE